MATTCSASDKGVRLCMCFPPGCNGTNMGALKRCSPGHRPGDDKGFRRRSGLGGVMYNLCLLYFLLPRRADEFLVLVPLPPILLPVAVNSPAYPVLFSSNVNLSLPFIDLATTTLQLEEYLDHGGNPLLYYQCLLHWLLYPVIQCYHRGLSVI